MICDEIAKSKLDILYSVYCTLEMVQLELEMDKLLRDALREVTSLNFPQNNTVQQDQSVCHIFRVSAHESTLVWRRLANIQNETYR